MTTEQQYIHIDAYGNKRTYKDRDMKILHCAAGPAVEYSDGTKIWYLNNKLHRIDGPAFEGADGIKEWYADGKRHRTDGPAIETADGTKIWYLDGKRHRIDGPAAEYSDGYKAWYVNGERFTEKEFNDRISPTLELTLEDIASKFGVDVNKLKITK